MDLTILFSTTKIPAAKIIQKVTKSKASHVAIAFDDFTLGCRVVMQAWWNGFEIITIEQWNKENIKLAEFAMLIGRRRMGLDLGLADSPSASSVNYLSVISITIGAFCAL